MIDHSIDRLQFLCDTIPDLLLNFDEKTFNDKKSPEKWSKKEVIGHLIDSATNNHRRLVRGQFEAQVHIKYDQNQWNAFNFYQQIDGQQIISFWAIYNKQLLELIKRIPAENLKNEVIRDKTLLTLAFIIKDYVAHLEHHLRQVVAF